MRRRSWNRSAYRTGTAAAVCWRKRNGRLEQFQGQIKSLDKLEVPSYDFSNTIASGHGDQVQQRTLFDFQNGAPDSRQPAWFCPGEDAQALVRNDDRTSVLFGR